MLYDTHHIATESDMHGEPCPVCYDAPSTTNIYVTNEDDGGDSHHTCVATACITETLARYHHGDDTPLVELSSAPMPWLVATIAPAAEPAGRVA